MECITVQNKFYQLQTPLQIMSKDVQIQMAQIDTRITLFVEHYQHILEEGNQLPVSSINMGCTCATTCQLNPQTNCQLKYEKIKQIQLLLENVLSFHFEILEKYKKLEQQCEQKQRSIGQLEEYMTEISEQFMISKDKLNNAVERLTITNQILINSENEYENKLNEKIEMIKHLQGQIDFLTQKNEKLHRSSLSQNLKNQQLSTKNEELHMRVLRLEALINGISNTHSNNQKDIQCSKVIQRVRTNQIKLKTNREYEKVDIDFDNLTKANDTEKSSPTRKNRSILIDNPIARKLVYNRTRPKSHNLIKLNDSLKDQQGSKKKTGFFSFIGGSNNKYE